MCEKKLALYLRSKNTNENHKRPKIMRYLINNIFLSFFFWERDRIFYV